MDQVQILSLLASIGFAACAARFFQLGLERRDDLFWAFGLALALLAIAQIGSSAPAQFGDTMVWPYVVRLAAFLIVIVKILRTHLAH